MRQLNTSAVNEKSGTKRVAPTPVVTGEHRKIIIVHQLLHALLLKHFDVLLQTVVGLTVVRP